MCMTALHRRLCQSRTLNTLHGQQFFLLFNTYRRSLLQNIEHVILQLCHNGPGTKPARMHDLLDRHDLPGTTF